MEALKNSNDGIDLFIFSDKFAGMGGTLDRFPYITNRFCYWGFARLPCSLVLKIDSYIFAQSSPPW